MDKLSQLHNLKEVKESILVEMKEIKKLYKYSELPNARELAQHIEYNCIYTLREDFAGVNEKEFPNEVGTYLFHKVFMDYCPYLYMKWYEENYINYNDGNPIVKVEGYKQAVNDLKNTYAKDFPNSYEKMVFVDLKRVVLGNLLNVEEQYQEMLMTYRYLLANRNLKEKKTQNELIEMLEILEGIDAQTKNIKMQIKNLALKKS